MSTTSRGQTTIDFAVGTVIFLVIVSFVFLFVGNAVSPFTGNAQDDTVTANRVADKLAGDLLGAPGDPYVLDTNCTRSFFASFDGGPVPADCAYEDDPLNERVGVTDRQNLNVTVLGNLTGPPTQTDVAEPLCWNDTDRQLVNRSDASACDVALTEGPDPAGEGSTIAARRVVSLADRDVTLIVEAW